MPTDDMTAISAKVRTDEKALFEQLCDSEGLTSSKAIRSFILACNEPDKIAKMKDRDAEYKDRFWKGSIHREPFHLTNKGSIHRELFLI